MKFGRENWWWPGAAGSPNAFDKACSLNPAFERFWTHLEKFNGLAIAYHYELDARLGNWGGYPFGAPFCALGENQFNTLLDAVKHSAWYGFDERRKWKKTAAVARRATSVDPSWVTIKCPKGEAWVRLAADDRALRRDYSVLAKELGCTSSGNAFLRKVREWRVTYNIPAPPKTSTGDRGREFSWQGIEALDFTPPRGQLTPASVRNMQARARRDFDSRREHFDTGALEDSSWNYQIMSERRCMGID